MGGGGHRLEARSDVPLFALLKEHTGFKMSRIIPNFCFILEKLGKSKSTDTKLCGIVFAHACIILSMESHSEKAGDVRDGE